MYSRSLSIVYLFIVYVNSEHENRRHETRQGRFFSFNTLDEDIRVDLDFSIPFISIPTRKAMNSVFGVSELPTININPASLALGGVVILSTTVLLPLLLKGFTSHYADERYSRLIDSTEFSSDAVISLTNMILSKKHGLYGCPQRIACLAAQSDIDHNFGILHNFVSNRLLSAMVNLTSIEDAIMSGRNGRDCTSYAPCPLREQHITMLMNKITTLNKS